MPFKNPGHHIEKKNIPEKTKEKEKRFRFGNQKFRRFRNKQEQPLQPQ